MLIPTLIMGALAALLLAIGYSRGQGQDAEGLLAAWHLTIEILPMLLFAFIVAGMIQSLVPQELITRWVGEESGLKGILLGSIAGGVCPGGPYVSLPIVAGLLRSGASVSVAVSFITGWAVWAVARLPMEVGIVGWRVTAIRLACSFFVPPLAGLLAMLIFRS